jgi:hypothetical protein
VLPAVVDQTSIDGLVRDLSRSFCFPGDLLALNSYVDFKTYRWDGHRIVHVDRVGFEMVREGSKKQLRYHTALLYVEIVLDLVITPVG